MPLANESTVFLAAAWTTQKSGFQLVYQILQTLMHMMVFVAYLQKKLSNLHALSVLSRVPSAATYLYAAIEVAKEFG